VQQHIAELAAPLRERLADHCEWLLTIVDRAPAAAADREPVGAVHAE
jgi:hypothetical protein